MSRPKPRRKLVILNGEMAEWSMAHAWKAKRVIPNHSEARQRIRDQRLTASELSPDVRPETSMFFEVVSLTYHSPITIAFF
jgi:hypothetical protein